MGTQPVRVAIDLETTGLHPEQDAVIEVGALKFAGDEVIESFESFVALPPGIPLPYRVRRLTGISPSQLRGAPPLADLVPRLRVFLSDLPLVGHSVPFDAAFLRRAGLARHNPLVDTYELASVLLPDLSSYTLTAVGTALGVSNPTHHRALADALLSRDVFLALLARLETLDATTLDALGRLAAPSDWTPGYFIRTTLRGRQKPARALSGGAGGLGGGTLGDQLAAKLGIDPAALSLAIGGSARARSSGTPPQPAPDRNAVARPAPGVSETDGSIQSSLGNAVDDCLTSSSVLAVETAPDDADVEACLAAALRWAIRNDEQVLVSVADGESAARIQRDILPRAHARAGLAAESTNVALLGTRDSYLCLHRWYGAARIAHDGQLPRDLVRGLARLTVWAARTSTGSRAEVSLTGQESSAWERARGGSEFADSSDTCTYRRDGYCYVARAEHAARDARVVLTTHAALVARLTGADTLLPDIARVVVLEAHLLEDELRRSATFTLDRQNLLDTLASLAETEPNGGRAGYLHLAAIAGPRDKAASREQTWFAHVGRARRATDTLFQELRGLLAESQGDSSGAPNGSEPPEQRTLRLDARTRRLARWPRIAGAWGDLAARLETVVRVAREAARESTAMHGKGPVSSDGVATDLLGICRVLEFICRRGAALFDSGTDDNRVAWLRVPYAASNGNASPWQRGSGDRRPAAKRSDSHQQRRAVGEEARDIKSPEQDAVEASIASPAGGEDAGDAGDAGDAPVVHSAPVHVGTLLAPLVAPGRSLALTSPALAVAGDFAYLRGSLGLPDSLRTLSFADDRTGQTLLCMPDDVPEPNAAQYQRHLDDALASFATAFGGRLVAIFPSHAALRAGAQGIRRKLEREDILVLAQGQDGSARQLWQTFRSEPRVVLLGAGAFWGGTSQLDQPPACVVVTRVPFPAMSDPLLAARADTWTDQQNQFVVPHAALRLRQALGGLAWSHRRRNAVVLFDRRLQTRAYGPTILGTLPSCTQYQDPVERIAERMVEWVDGSYGG